MIVAGIAAASPSAGQQVQSLMQHKSGRHPSIAEVDMQGANPVSMSGPIGRPGHKVDITA